MDTAELETSRVHAPVVAKPSVESPPRSRWWVYVILLLVAAGFGYFVYNRLMAAKENAASAGDKRRAVHDLPVVVAKSRRGDLDQYLIGLGSVTPLETVTVKSRVDGAITKIAFTEGQLVHQGDLLIEIDSRPYEAALKQAEGQLAKDTAAKASADWNVQQDEMAIKDNGISQQVLHNDTAVRDQAAGAIEIDQAAIDTAKLNLEYSHITSPITGRIGLKIVDVGNIVHAGDTTGLAVINELQPITVVFTLPEDNIQLVQKRIATGESLPVDAYDRDVSKKLATGVLLAIDNQVDPSTGTVRIKAKFENQNNELFPSQFVNARLRVNTIRDAVLIPTAAVQHSPGSTFAYVVKPAPVSATNPTESNQSATTKPGKGGGGISGEVSVREITTGASQASVGSEGEDTTVVVTGLEAGEIVVTDGVDKLQDGTKVTYRPSKRASTQPAATTQKMATTQHSRRERAKATHGE